MDWPEYMINQENFSDLAFLLKIEDKLIQKYIQGISLNLI